MTLIDIPQRYYENPYLIKAHIRDLEIQFLRGYLDIEGHARLNELRHIQKRLKEKGAL